MGLIKLRRFCLPKHTEMFQRKTISIKIVGCSPLLAKDFISLFVEFERWIRKIRLVFNNSTRRTEFPNWQTGEFIHIFETVEWNNSLHSFCSLFDIGSKVLWNVRFPEKEKCLAQSKNRGPHSFSVHWSFGVYERKVPFRNWLIAIVKEIFLSCLSFVEIYILNHSQSSNYTEQV